MSNDNPQLSIGMPVYNGAQFIKEALDSILAQTFEDFELIISDNASTDETEEICRAYVAKDHRIRYYRNEENIGAAQNFNRVFELSSGKYFKWVACDDIYAPDFIWKCIEVLEQDPTVILCHSKIKLIDETGRFLQNYEIELNTDSPKPQVRFHELLSKHMCFQIFGIIRSKILRMTSLFGNYGYADGVLLWRLGFLGRFHEIPEYLLLYRIHPQQSISRFCPNVLAGATSKNSQSLTSLMPDFYAYTVWFYPAKEGQIFLPHWRIFRECWSSVWQAQLSWYERMSCYLSMLKQWQGTEFLLIKDLIIGFMTIIQIFKKIVNYKCFGEREKRLT